MFRAKFQLLSDPLAQLAFLSHDLWIEISLHRQAADFYKLYDDRQVGIVPSFSMLARYPVSMFTFSAKSFRARFFAFRASFTSAPKLSNPGQFLTFAI